MKWVKPVSNLRLAMWATAVLIFAESFMFSVPLAHAETLGSWTPTTALRQGIVTVGSGPSPLCVLNTGYIYCVSGQNATSMFATESNGVIGTWSITTRLPNGGVRSYPASLSCFTFDNYINCLYEDYLGGHTNYAYYAPLNGAGIGAWTSTNVFANSGDFACGQSGKYVICDQDLGFTGGSQSIFYSTMGSSGGFSAWTATTAFTTATASNSIFGTSKGGSSFINIFQTGGGIYTAPLTGGAAGTWSANTNYPIAAERSFCMGAGNYAYCFGGDIAGTVNSAVYYAKVGNSGTLSAWTATSSLLTAATFLTCTVDALFYFDCLGGQNTAGTPLKNTEYSQAAQLGQFTCAITNMDAGNDLLPNGKAYDFQCTVQSDALPAPNGKITDVRIQFNDSLHVIVADYSNNTNVPYGIGFSILNGSAYATLSNSGNVVSAYDSTTGIRTMTVDFLITLTPAILDSSNRGIQMLVLGANPLTQTRGYEYVQTNYFNIINLGGGVSVLSSGACGRYPGSDTFQAACHYGANAHNWIAENATYSYLQSYQAQFYLETDNQSSPYRENSTQLGYFWQPYSQSGPGTNPSANKGDWKLRYGMYHYDNTTWVKGINVLLETGNGRVGSNNLWTEFNALWYNGNTLISNQSLYDFVPDINLGQVNIYVYLWYSQNNASTVQGGAVNAYYTGMHKSNYLLWSTWSPFLQNQTQSQVFMPLLDHSGNVMSAQTAQFSKVFMNLTRPGAPLVNAKQYNFQIQTGGFKQQEFNVAQPGAMAGVTTPTFATVIVPTITSSSIFTPIVNALKALASWIAKATIALGTYVWGVLQHNFPWLTSTMSFYGSVIVGLVKVVGNIGNALLIVLTTLINNLGAVTTWFTIFSNAWGYVGTMFSAFGGTSTIEGLIEIYILITGAAMLFEAFQSKDPTKAVFHIIGVTWTIVDRIFTWTWMIVKFLVDTLEGLIP